jgi:3-methyladenine DNA glycosylase AlkD
MSVTELLAELESLGSEQTRKTYRRHGVTGPQFGVSYADLGRLRKRIRKDQALAEGLWASGNHDARVLATMVADPAAMDEARLEAWARGLDSYVLAGALSEVAARSPAARALVEKWRRSSVEWIEQAGWDLLGHLANDGGGEDGYFVPFLERIEREIHGARNRVRYAMNGALIAIGSRGGELETRAMEAARRIGKVEVDHGETGCKTPDAAAYIPKAAEHKRRKAAKSGR